MSFLHHKASLLDHDTGLDLVIKTLLGEKYTGLVMEHIVCILFLPGVVAWDEVDVEYHWWICIVRDAEDSMLEDEN